MAVRGIAVTSGVALLVAFELLSSPASATTDTEIGIGIGTHVADVFGGGSGAEIHTAISSVAYEPPVVVKRRSLEYFEVLGTVQGTGWGGEFQDLSNPGAPPEASLSHYSYSMPFVLRWPVKDWDGTMVQYAHGFSPLGLSALMDSIIGDGNEARRFDIAEGAYVSDAVLSNDRRHAFFAINLSGLDRNGQFSAIASEGPFEGQPLNPSVDVPVTRDMSQVAKRLLAKLAGKAVARAIGTGHSGGGLIMQWIASNRGFSLNAGAPMFDGGNFVNALDPSSGTVFQGVVPMAGGGFFPVNTQFPLTAKAILISGDTDYAGVDHVRYADRILRTGFDLNGSVRIYQFRNLPHSFAEIVESTPNQNAAIAENFGFSPSADADHMAPVVAAAIDNMDRWLTNGAAPPLSRINGEARDEDNDGVVDRIVFSLLNGQTTSFAPFVENATLDHFFGETFELTSAVDQPVVTRYAEVLTSLGHVSGSVALPNLRCRLGGYDFFNDATLRPFENLSAHWKNFGAYDSCIQHAMNDLSMDGLYDKRIGKNVVITDEARALFGK